MEKLYLPTLLCNSLITAEDGSITGYNLRQKHGKRKAVKAFRALNIKVFAAGDSYNDLEMIREANCGCLFRAPDSIKEKCKKLNNVDSYGDLMKEIDRFLIND